MNTEENLKCAVYNQGDANTLTAPLDCGLVKTMAALQVWLHAYRNLPRAASDGHRSGHSPGSFLHATAQVKVISCMEQCFICRRVYLLRSTETGRETQVEETLQVRLKTISGRALQL